VYGYKFYRRQENQRLLVDLLFERATQILCQKRLAKPEAHPDGLPFWPVLPVLIIPIPARSPHRDHSQKLAKALSYRLHGGVYQPVLEWQREAKEQHHLGSAAARRHNIRGAFGLKASDVKACKNPGLILVIDDLMTTGSTMKEAIQTLQAAYDTSIVGLSVMNVTYGGQKRHAGAASEKLLTDVNCLETDLASVLFEADDAPEWVLPKLS
jgi:predicted amidophosphoribosyltransferase